VRFVVNEIKLIVQNPIRKLKNKNGRELNYDSTLYLGDSQWEKGFGDAGRGRVFL
jgi:hypothetical protein